MLHISLADARKMLASDEIPFFRTRRHGELTPQLICWLHGRGNQGMSRYFCERWPFEEEFQAKLIDTFYAITTPDFEAFHIPNGGHRSKAAAARMKQAGQRSGVFDLFMGWHGGFGWMECKSRKGTVSMAQKEFREWAEGCRMPCCVVQTIAEGVAALIRMGAPVDKKFHGIGQL